MLENERRALRAILFDKDTPPDEKAWLKDEIGRLTSSIHEINRELERLAPPLTQESAVRIRSQKYQAMYNVHRSIVIGLHSESPFIVLSRYALCVTT